MSTERPIKKRSPKRVAASEAASPDAMSRLDFSSIEGGAVSLYSVSFNQSISPEGLSLNHNLACSVHNYVSQESKSVGFCEFVVTRTDGDTNYAEVRASYLYVIVSDPIRSAEDRKKSIELFTSLSLWPRFKGLVGVINLQSDAEFPRLPMSVPTISYKDTSAVTQA